ncbi:Isochorismatase hydrolase [Hypoxylon sp. FL1284]|nr:Isochorismatase hydrolase [Hypoxylon sp. FL1284]
MEPPQHPGEGALTFGSNYAVLNLDWMTILVDTIKDTPEGQKFISNCSLWNDAVRQVKPKPLVIFTTLFFNPGELELVRDAPFSRLVRGFGSFAAGSADVQIASRFTVDEDDVVLRKTRWYAGAGNDLEQILKAHNVDTVILSGMSLSGVVMSTIYRLFDLDYNIFVISDNLLDLPPGQNPEHSSAMLNILVSKMNLRVISIGDAIQMLKRS